jgi:hypothetical protein
VFPDGSAFMSTKGAESSEGRYSQFKPSQGVSGRVGEEGRAPARGHQGEKPRTPYLDLRGVEYRGEQGGSTHAAQVETIDTRRSGVDRDRGQIQVGRESDPRYSESQGISKETLDFNKALKAMAEVVVGDNNTHTDSPMESGSSSPKPRCITHKREKKPLENARQGMKDIEDQINRFDTQGLGPGTRPESALFDPSAKSSSSKKEKEREKERERERVTGTVSEFTHSSNSGSSSSKANKDILSPLLKPPSSSNLNRNNSGSNISIGNGKITPQSRQRQGDPSPIIDPYEDDFEILEEVEDEEEEELELIAESEGHDFDIDSVLRKNRYGMVHTQHDTIRQDDVTCPSCPLSL